MEVFIPPIREIIEEYMFSWRQAFKGSLKLIRKLSKGWSSVRSNFNDYMTIQNTTRNMDRWNVVANWKKIVECDGCRSPEMVRFMIRVRWVNPHDDHHMNGYLCVTCLDDEKVYGRMVNIARMHRL